MQLSMWRLMVIHLTASQQSLPSAHAASSRLKLNNKDCDPLCDGAELA